MRGREKGIGSLREGYREEGGSDTTHLFCSFVALQFSTSISKINQIPNSKSASLVFICRENARRSGISQFPDRLTPPTPLDETFVKFCSFVTLKFSYQSQKFTRCRLLNRYAWFSCRENPRRSGISQFPDRLKLSTPLDETFVKFCSFVTLKFSYQSKKFTRYRILNR